MCLICTCPPPYSTRLFGNSLASGSIGTPKLSEFGREQSQDGIHWEVPKNKTVRAWPKADNIVLRAESRLGCDNSSLCFSLTKFVIYCCIVYFPENFKLLIITYSLY